MLRTHQYLQYGIRYGKKVMKYRRMKKKGLQGYTSPSFIGTEWFPTVQAAESFLNGFNKPLAG